LVDVVSAGIIDNTFNMLGDLTVEDWKDVDLGFIAPGLDFPRLFDMQLRNIMTQPTKVVFGPFGNIASNTLEAFDMVSKIHTGDPDLPAADKFMRSADLLGSAVMPAYNDNAKAYIGYKMGIWYNTTNEALPLRTTYNGLIARGLFGARTKEELSYYTLQRTFGENEEDFRQVVNENRKFFKTMVSLYYDGVATKEQVHQRIGALVNWWEDMPEGVRTEMMMQSMEGIEQDDLIQDSVYKQIVDKALANPRFDPAQIDHLVDRFTDIPPEKREQLRSLLKEAHDSRVYVDSKALEQLEDGN
jgi:hypothetical protein